MNEPDLLAALKRLDAVFHDEERDAIAWTLAADELRNLLPVLIERLEAEVAADQDWLVGATIVRALPDGTYLIETTSGQRRRIWFSSIIAAARHEAKPSLSESLDDKVTESLRGDT